LENNDLYQIILFFSAIAGCLGAGALLLQIPGPLRLLVFLAPLVGFIYGEIQAQIVCKFPRIRERGEVTTNGLCKVGCPYLIVTILIIILFPVFEQARAKERARRHLPPRRGRPTWVLPTAMALPVALSSVVAVVGWGLHASERRRGRR
jgi:hypothetical protein